MDEGLDEIKAHFESIGKPLLPNNLVEEECVKLKQYVAVVGVDAVLREIGVSRPTYYCAARGVAISPRVAAKFRKALARFNPATAPHRAEVAQLSDRERESLKEAGISAVTVESGVSLPTVYAAANGRRISPRVLEALRSVLARRINALKQDVLHAVIANVPVRTALQHHVWNLGVLAMAERTGIPGETICAVMSGGSVRASVLNTLVAEVGGVR